LLLFGSSFKIQLNNLNETTPGLKGNPLIYKTGNIIPAYIKAQSIHIK